MLIGDLRADPRGMTLDKWYAVACKHDKQFEPVDKDEGYTYLSEML